MPKVGFGHNKISSDAVAKAAEEIQREKGGTWSEAIREATSTLDGAGDTRSTVESTQTCRDIGGRFVSGLTTDDSPRRRSDRFAGSDERRRRKAEQEKDEAAEWLKINDPERHG